MDCALASPGDHPNYYPWSSNASITSVTIVGNVKAAENSSYLFFNLPNMVVIDGLTNLDTSDVTTTSDMFYSCFSLTALDLSNFDTSKVTNMVRMFSYCSSLTELNIANFRTDNVTIMDYMFDSCSSLTTLDLYNFNTSKVTSM